MDEIEQEFENALAEGRQPNCPYCRAPLVVRHICDYVHDFVWNDKIKKYKKYEWLDGGATTPECENCEAKSWDFVGQLEAGRKLGLDY